MEMGHFVVNLVRLCKQTYDLCLPFDLARLYVCFSFCNDDLSWIKMIEFDVLLNIGFNEDLRDTFIYYNVVSVVGSYGLHMYMVDE